MVWLVVPAAIAASCNSVVYTTRTGARYVLLQRGAFAVVSRPRIYVLLQRVTGSRCCLNSTAMHPMRGTSYWHALWNGVAAHACATVAAMHSGAPGATRAGLICGKRW